MHNENGSGVNLEYHCSEPLAIQEAKSGKDHMNIQVQDRAMVYGVKRTPTLTDSRPAGPKGYSTEKMIN